MKIRDLLFSITVISSLVVFFYSDLNAQPLYILRSDITDLKKAYPKYTVLDFGYHYGKHLPTNSEEFNETIGLKPSTAVDITYGPKGYSRKRWHSIYKYPGHGVGWFSCNYIPNENLVGNPNAIYLWHKQPLIVWEKFQIDADLGVGLSYYFRPRINLFQAEKDLSIRPEPIHHLKVPFHPKWEFYLLENGGTAAPGKYWEHRNIYYPMVLFGIDAARHYAHMGEYGVGYDIFYDALITDIFYDQDSFYPSTVAERDKFVYGLHHGHEFMVHHWSIATQLAFNLNHRNIRVTGMAGLAHATIFPCI